MEKWGYFQEHEKHGYPWRKLFILLGNACRSTKRGFGCFFQPKEVLKMVFGVRSIRMFLQFSVGSLL